jgi:hypothetical protein
MTLLKRLKQILTLTCEESTRLASESLERRLTRGERVAVRAHVMLCRSCRLFQRQIALIREAIRRGEATSDLSGSLSLDQRHRLRQALADADGKNSS